MEDSRIVELLWARSEQAITELSTKYQGLCMKIAVNILDDEMDAQECVNDTYLAVWNSVPPQRPDPLRAYVCRVTRNLALVQYRKRTAQKRNSRYDAALDELLEVIGHGESVQDACDARELAEIINGFLAELSKTDRYLFVRRYWFSEPVSELAQSLGLRAHTVSVRLFRIRQRLKKNLNQRGIEV